MNKTLAASAITLAILTFQPASAVAQTATPNMAHVETCTDCQILRALTAIRDRALEIASNHRDLVGRLDTINNSLQQMAASFQTNQKRPAIYVPELHIQYTQGTRDAAATIYCATINYPFGRAVAGSGFIVTSLICYD